VLSVKGHDDQDESPKSAAPERERGAKVEQGIGKMKKAALQSECGFFRCIGNEGQWIQATG